MFQPQSTSLTGTLQNCRVVFLRERVTVAKQKLKKNDIETHLQEQKSKSSKNELLQVNKVWDTKWLSSR